MKKALTVCLTVALVASVAVAAELKSGLEPGKLIGPFDVVKCAGPDDNVKVGSELCYRCKYGARPMVMVFSRLDRQQRCRAGQEAGWCRRCQLEQATGRLCQLAGGRS